MSDRCTRPFDEALLSGYLDGALTQGEEQKVRIHLEDCPSCRDLFNDLKTTREVTMTTRFETPPDDQWNEAPRSGASRLSFSLGWMMVVVYVVGILAFAAWQFATGPEGLMEKLLIFGGGFGVFLLFLSVLLDRFKTYADDPYRRVEK